MFNYLKRRVEQHETRTEDVEENGENLQGEIN